MRNPATASGAIAAARRPAVTLGDEMRKDVRQSLRFLIVASGLALAGAGPVALAADPAPTGEDHYRRVCADCHDRGATNNLAKGSPKLGDRRAWESRVGKGIDALFQKITQARLHGKAGDAVWEKTNPFIWREDLSDEDIRLALRHMFEQVE